MGPATPIGGRPTIRRHPVLVAVAGAITLAGLGVGQLSIAWASADTAGTVDVTAEFTAFTVTAADSLAGYTPNEGPPAGSAAADDAASRVPLALPSTLQLDSPAEAAVHVAALDARLAAAETALTTADGVLAASVGKADETVRAPLAEATQTLRSLRGQRTHPGIPGATAAVVRLTGPVLAATTAYDVEQARLAAVAAESARLAAEAARAADLAAAGASAAAGSGAGAGGSDLTAVGEATLRSLPGNGGVHLAWNHAAIGSHLGGVFLDQQTEIMINGRQLAATPGRTASVVKHEMGHIYQARIIAAEASGRGGWSASYAAMTARLNAVFGGNGQEKSADCVALRFGATWVAYSSDCGGDRQAAVDALLAGRMP